MHTFSTRFSITVARFWMAGKCWMIFVSTIREFLAEEVVEEEVVEEVVVEEGEEERLCT